MRRAALAVLLAALLGPSCAHDTSVTARVAVAQQLVDEAEAKLKAANDLIKVEGDLDQAGEYLAEAQELTQDPRMIYYVDRENLEDRVSQAGTRLAAARDAKHRREIAAKVPARKERATALLAELRSAADLLQDRAHLDRKRAGRAREALDGALRFLDESKEFEIDAGWTSFAATARKELVGRTVQGVLAEALMSFREGPVAHSAKAKRLFEESKGAKPADRSELLGQARDAWLACSKDAAALVAQTPALEREALHLAGTKATVKSFAAACAAQARSAEGLLKAPAKGTPPPAKKPPPAKTRPAKKK